MRSAMCACTVSQLPALIVPCNMSPLLLCHHHYVDIFHRPSTQVPETDQHACKIVTRSASRIVRIVDSTVPSIAGFNYQKKVSSWAEPSLLLRPLRDKNHACYIIRTSVAQTSGPALVTRPAFPLITFTAIHTHPRKV